MKRIIDSTLVILSLMLIFGCKESKVGQGNPTKDSMSIDTDSVISGKVFNKQDVASEDTQHNLPSPRISILKYLLCEGRKLYKLYLSLIQRTILLTQMVAGRIAV